MGSTSPVGGVAIRCEEQWNMVVLLSIQYAKDDFDIGVKAFEAATLIVGFGLEVNAIEARLQRESLRKQVFAAAICVGNCIVEKRPRAVLHERKRDGNFGCGTPECCV